MTKTAAIKKQRAFLFFWTGQFLYIGKGIDTKIHDHHAIQIAVSFDDPIEIKFADSSLKSKAVIIHSDQPHECKTGDNTFMLLNIAPESKIGIVIKKNFLLNKKIYELPGEQTLALLTGLKEELKTKDKSKIVNITQKFLATLFAIEKIQSLDERIVKTQQLINSEINVPLTINYLAANVLISPGRLIHLFTEQVGIPIRKYILWTKLLTAVHALINTTNFTQAALEGGFSDAPHFNKTFKRMFGLNPSALLKNSQIVQVYHQ